MELRRRVEVLEKRLGKNWLVSPSWIKRTLGVLGYLFLGYVFICIIAWTIIGIIKVIMFSRGQLSPF